MNISAKRPKQAFGRIFRRDSAFGASVGKKFIGDPEVWRVVDGKLYLNLDTSIQSEWLKDVPGRIRSADANWRNIKDKNPASL